MALRVTHHLHSSLTFSLLIFSKQFPRFSFSPPSPTLLSLQTRRRRPSSFFCSSSTSSMASDSSSLTHTITLPSQPGYPVHVVAAPGISPSEFRSAIESSLFQQWLKNLQGEKGALSDGAMSLHKVLIQGVDYFGKSIGFLKFKADIVDKETGKKVPGIVFARGAAVAILILLESEGIRCSY